MNFQTKEKTGKTNQQKTKQNINLLADLYKGRPLCVTNNNYDYFIELCQ